MINLVRSGSYKLIETKKHTKVLHLDDDTFAWVEPVAIGEILVVARAVHTTDCVLSLGEYRLYVVDDEPDLVDITHLELEIGQGQWQGYLLLTGLPDKDKKRSRIIPCNEIITGNPKFASRYGKSPRT
jgi:hypothetical protein